VLLTKDTMAKMLLLPQVRHSKLLKKQKELNLEKIVPLKVLVDNERWKVFVFKGMYIARMPTLI